MKDIIPRLIEFIRRHEILCLFCLVYFIYNINCKTIGSGDTIPASLLPFSILENHNLYLDQFYNYFESNSLLPFFAKKIDEHLLSVYPIVTPILITPLYVLPFLFLKSAHIPIDMLNPGFALAVSIMEKLSAALIASISVIFVFLSVKELTNKRTATIVALIFAFATNTWATSSQALWQHGLIELLLAVSIYLILMNEKSASDKIIVSLGIISGLFIFNRSADSILLIPVILYILALRDQRIIYYFGAMALACSPFLFYNLQYFSNLFGGYGDMATQIHFNSEAIIGFIGMLISPSRGIFIYTPIMLFSIFGYFKIFKLSNNRVKNFLFASGFSVLGQILLYGAFICWWAGWCYGPRFLTGILPVLAIFLGLYIKDVTFDIRIIKNLIVRHIFYFLLIWSVFTQFVGAFYYPNGDWDSTPDVGLHPERLWEWNDIQITRTFGAGIALPSNYIKDLLTIVSPAQEKDIIAEGTLGKGWYRIETWDGISTRWMEDDALISINSSENRNVNLSLRLTSFYRPRTLDIYAGDELALRANVSSTGFEDTTASIHLKKGTNTVRLHVLEGCDSPKDKLELKSPDPRCLSVAAQNLTVV